MGSHGGRRPGAGRKPKTARERLVDGNAGHRGRVLTHPSAASTAPEPIEEFDAPDVLTFAERAVWLQQAPFAFGAGTLTRGSSLAFCRYCRLVVQESEMAADVEKRSGPDQRGLARQINALELQFSLVPCGKPMRGAEAEPKKPANPLDRFIGRAK